MFTLLLLFFMINPITYLAALSDNAESVLENARLFSKSPFMKIEVDMVIRNSSGEKTRGLDISISNSNNEYKLYMQIISPSFLRQMKFLQLNSEDEKTLQWVATSRGARKITSSGNDERIFDSDFTAADFSSINPEEFRIDNFSETILDGIDCYRLELTAKNDYQAIDKKILFIDRDSYFILKVEYYSENVLTKSYNVISTREINGNIFPEESVMEDLIQGSSTKLVFKKYETPDSIPDKVFHYKNL